MKKRFKTRSITALIVSLALIIPLTLITIKLSEDQDGVRIFNRSKPSRLIRLLPIDLKTFFLKNDGRTSSSDSSSSNENDDGKIYKAEDHDRLISKNLSSITKSRFDRDEKGHRIGEKKGEEEMIRNERDAFLSNIKEVGTVNEEIFYREPNLRMLKPRQAQVVVLTTTTYPGTDTIFATKTVVIGQQPTPAVNNFNNNNNNNNGGIVTIQVDSNNHPIGQAPQVTKVIPNIAVATVTVYSSSEKRISIDKFRLTVLMIKYLGTFNLLNIIFGLIGFNYLI